MRKEKTSLSYRLDCEWLHSNYRYSPLTLDKLTPIFNLAVLELYPVHDERLTQREISFIERETTALNTSCQEIQEPWLLAPSLGAPSCATAVRYLHHLLIPSRRSHPMVLVLVTKEVPIAGLDVPITTVLSQRRTSSWKQSSLSYGKAGSKRSLLSLIIISVLLLDLSRSRAMAYIWLGE